MKNTNAGFDTLKNNIKEIQLTLENETNRKIDITGESHGILNRK